MYCCKRIVHFSGISAQTVHKDDNRSVKMDILSMQQERYDNLRMAIEKARQAKHDMRHHFRQLCVMAEAGELEKIKKCNMQLTQPVNCIL